MHVQLAKLNRFKPGFLKWAISLLNSNRSIFQKRVSVYMKIRMASSVDPGETVRYQPSHLDLHFMLRVWFNLHG